MFFAHERLQQRVTNPASFLEQFAIARRAPELQACEPVSGVAETQRHVVMQQRVGCGSGEKAL